MEFWRFQSPLLKGLYSAYLENVNGIKSLAGKIHEAKIAFVSQACAKGVAILFSESLARTNNFHNYLGVDLVKSFKTEFARGPGRADTCHLSDLDETLPD